MTTNLRTSDIFRGGPPDDARRGGYVCVGTCRAPRRATPSAASPEKLNSNRPTWNQRSELRSRSMASSFGPSEGLFLAVQFFALANPVSATELSNSVRFQPKTKQENEQVCPKFVHPFDVPGLSKFQKLLFFLSHSVLVHSLFQTSTSKVNASAAAENAQNSVLCERLLWKDARHCSAHFSDVPPGVTSVQTHQFQHTSFDNLTCLLFRFNEFSRVKRNDSEYAAQMVRMLDTCTFVCTFHCFAAQKQMTHTSRNSMDQMLEIWIMLRVPHIFSEKWGTVASFSQLFILEQCFHCVCVWFRCRVKARVSDSVVQRNSTTATSMVILAQESSNAAVSGSCCLRLQTRYSCFGDREECLISAYCCETVSLERESLVSFCFLQVSLQNDYRHLWLFAVCFGQLCCSAGSTSWKSSQWSELGKSMHKANHCN